MLPRVTITPDLSGRTVHSAKHFSKPTADHSRSGRKPVRAAFVPTSSSRLSATKVLSNVTPTRRSFEKPLEPGAPAPGIQSCILDADSVGSSPDLQQQALSDATISSSSATPSSSATNLHRSDSDLALLLNGADLSRPGTTTINIGSIPISVPIAYLEVPAAEANAGAAPAALVEQQQVVAAEAEEADIASQADAEGERSPSKLNPASAEFYPQTYLAAAAATAIASAAVASSSSSSSPQAPPNSAAVSAAGSEEEEQEEEVEAADQQQVEPVQQYWHQAEGSQQQQQQQLHMQQWQQQQWHQWQQQAMPYAVPMFFPVPMPVPPYVVPSYSFAYQQMQQQQQQQPPYQQVQQQQHLQIHPIMLQQLPPPAPAAEAAAEDSVPATPAAASVAGSTMAPLSPSPSLPADTSSLMSTPTAAAGWALAHGSSLYSSSGSRPGSSASSVVSSYNGTRSRQQQQALRDAGTVTVSALSCVKDAAGALAKVVSRHGSCLLLSLSRAGDQAAQATHVAAKSLAVARFYVNARMAAAGAAGVDAAAVLTGLEPQTPTAAAATADDEVVFMPYHRSSGSRAAADAEPALGFVVAKACAKDLPAVLPPPVGIPACMQDRQQQDSSSSSGSAPTAPVSAASGGAAAAPLLKAGANTDVNKLSNAIIHNILGSNHVALQLAGAAACHVAMKALIKARSRLQRKFGADIVATASFANEDTSSSIGRSTVFLRLDVMRSNLLQQLSAVGKAVAGAVEGMAEQQQQPLMAGAAV